MSAPTLDPLPASDLTLNPAATHPPFAWYVGIPSDWALLDTNPQSWQRNAERLVDERFFARKLPAAERRAALGFVEQLVAECQRSGAALSMIQLGKMSTGAIGSAGLHLAWFDSAPNPAGLALVREALPASGTVRDVETPSGPALLHRDVASTVPPGAMARVRSTVWQLYAPVAGTTWTVVLSAATPHPELEPTLETLIVSVAQSIQRDAGEPGGAEDSAG